MFPDGLNRASVANPVYAVCAPRDRPTTLSIGEAVGVASNSAVNEPVCGEIAKFCHPPPEVTVAHPIPCNGPGAFMLLPVTTRIPIPKLEIVTPNSRKQINEKLFFVVFFIMDSIVIYLYLDRRARRPTACSCAHWRRRPRLASRSVRTDVGGAARTPQDRYAGERFPRLFRPTSGGLRPPRTRRDRP